MAKAVTIINKPKAEKPVNVIDTLVGVLNASEALSAKIEAISDADDVRAMGKVDIFRLVTDKEQGGLSPEQFAELPIPGTQGWIKPIYDATGEKLLNAEGVFGVNSKTGNMDYPAGYSNNPEYLRRKSDRQGSSQPVPYSRLEMFAAKLAPCVAWEAKALEQDALVEQHLLTENESKASYWRGKVSRTVTRIVDAIRLGHQLVASEQSPWDTKLVVEFDQRKEFKRDADGKFLRDKKNAAMFDMVDAPTDKPIVIIALDDNGVKTDQRFYKTVEQFLALDFKWAAEHDGKETPAGELATLLETLERAPKTGKDDVSIKNVPQTFSALLSLAGLLPAIDDDVTRAIPGTKGFDPGDVLDAMRTVQRHLAGYLNLQSNKKILAAWDAKDIADKEREAAEKAGKVEQTKAA